MLIERGLDSLAETILATCREKGVKLATAESCTGGLIAALLTSVAGSSDVFERGFVTYSNEAKHEAIGVPEDLIRRYGAVSGEVARQSAMAVVRLRSTWVAIAYTFCGRGSLVLGPELSAAANRY